MHKPELSKIQNVATALRKRADFFLETSPSDLGRDDFLTISEYLRKQADIIDSTIQGSKRKSMGRGFLAFLLYICVFGALCYGYYLYSPFEDRYYIKLAKELFNPEQTDQYVLYFKIGVSAFGALFTFFVSVFVSIIICGVFKLALPRLVNSVTEAVVAAAISAGAFYAYHQYVFLTRLAQSFL